jgi:hypothetical protein
MPLATQRKLVLYLTPLFVACVRLGWNVEAAEAYRSTYHYIEALVEWCLVLLLFWFLYRFVILMTAFVVVCASMHLGWIPPASQKSVSDEMDGIITLTWLVITLGGWLIRYWPAGSFD